MPKLQEQGYQCHWVPSSLRLIVGFQMLKAAFWKPSYLISVTTRTVEFDFSETHEISSPMLFSPGQHLIGESRKIGQVCCLRTGQRLWECNDLAPFMIGLTPESMLAFLPSGCGIVCQASLLTRPEHNIIVVLMYA